MTNVIHHSHMLDVTVSYHIMKSHDEYKRVVHRLYSSCISSIQNPVETLLSSFC